MISALKRLAASPASSLALIVGAAAAAAAGFLAPKWGVYGSPVFWSFGGLAACALACTLQLQARLLWRTRSVSVLGLDSREEAMKGILGKHGYRLAAAFGSGETRRFSFQRDGPGKYGSFLFHAGLFLVVLSGLWLAAFQKRAFLQLMEGETFQGAENEFLTLEKGPLAGAFSVPFGLRLGTLTHEYWNDGQVKDFASELFLLEEGREERRRVSVNHPLIAGGVAVYQSPHYGYSVSLALQRPDGSRPVTHFLIDKAPRINLPAVGRADFPTTGYVMSVSLRPDRRRKDFHLVDPELEVSVLRGERVLYRGPVPLQGSVRVGSDRLSLAGLRQWSGLNLVDRGGLGPARLGFILSALGAGLLFLLPEGKVVVGARAEGGWNVAPSSRREKALAREEASLIESELAARDAPRSRSHAHALL